MSRAIHKLTDAKVRALAKPGRHGDGGGLYLRITPAGSRSWIYVWQRDGRRTDLGMGAYPAVSLAAARRLATAHRETVAAGGDPQAAREAERVPTFGEAADAYIEAKAPGWTNEKHAWQWRQTLGDAYCRTLRRRPVDAVNLNDVLRVLTPIWATKPETATRLRGRIERVLGFAMTKGWRSEANVAVWRGNLENVLPPPAKLTRGHQAAMPHADVPAFLATLREREALAARALELLILTACRPGEVLRARWSEMDLDAAVWTIPAERMKARVEHVVPLTDAALALLRPLHDVRLDDYVFPGRIAGKPLSDMAMIVMLRKRMGITDAVPHGFRSSFRDWAGDETAFPREVAEGCLAHVVGSAVERAYRRSSAIAKRRALLEAWAGYVEGSSQRANVVALHGR